MSVRLSVWRASTHMSHHNLNQRSISCAVTAAPTSLDQPKRLMLLLECMENGADLRFASATSRGLGRVTNVHHPKLKMRTSRCPLPTHNRSLNGGPTWANTGLAAIGVAPAESCHSAFDPLLTFVICSITNK